jgi:hypothetical protein
LVILISKNVSCPLCIHAGVCTNIICTRFDAGRLALVPYDADKDNSPCLLGGARAHWALIRGVAVPPSCPAEQEILLSAHDSMTTEAPRQGAQDRANTESSALGSSEEKSTGTCTVGTACPDLALQWCYREGAAAGMGGSPSAQLPCSCTWCRGLYLGVARARAGTGVGCSDADKGDRAAEILALCVHGKV